MSWPFKDYDFYGDRYINQGEIMWYDRHIESDTPTECLICIEAEKEMYTKYAHPKAHSEAHTHATKFAETLAIEQTNTTDYLDYYTFYYSKEYKKIYKELYKKYKEEYNAILLSKSYDKKDNICQTHLESIQYYGELHKN